MSGNRPTKEQFASDPAFQADRDLFNHLIDERMKFHAEEAKKKLPPEQWSFWDILFGGKSNG